jgi:hypothetical protein
MRLTVGPLPAAVYWRRRAVVLGAVLLVVLAVSYTCSGPKAGSQPPPKSSPSAKASAKPSPTLQPAELISPTASTPATVTSPYPPIVDSSVDPRACTDAELRIIAKPVSTTVTRGQDVVIYLYIKNISNRTCTRDIGPDLQELRVVEGADKIWSSDDCGTARGSSPRSFVPNFEVSFNVDWNGKMSTTCTGSGASRAPSGPVPDAGRYQVLGRVGTAQSKPFTLTIS